MKCPFCGHEDTQVKDSRPSDDARTIRRRRECPSCARRFTTFERFQVQQIVVIKRDGRKELFDRDKLITSLQTALRKRPIGPQQVAQIATDIEQALADSGRSEVRSQDVGEAVLTALKTVDAVAYVRYASVYHDFANAQDFAKILTVC